MENPSLWRSIDFDQSAHPSEVDMDSNGIVRIKEIFNQQLQEDPHSAAQLVLLRYGLPVINLFGGFTDKSQRSAVSENTPFIIFSISKTLTTACILRLIDEGKVNWDAPIVDYWPEFGIYGKEKITVRHALLHQAGIPRQGLVKLTLFSRRWEDFIKVVEVTKPNSEPGTRTEYHAINFGFILGEVVCRVTGMPFQSYLQETFLRPLGMINTKVGLSEAELKLVTKVYSGSIDQHLPVLLLGRPAIRGAVVPAATIHSTARDLSIFFQMMLNGGIYAGRKYLESSTVHQATSLGYEGIDYAFNRMARWAYGFHLGGLHEIDRDDGLGKGSSIQTFAHFGQRSCMAWADRLSEIVLVFLSNRLISRENNRNRFLRISNAVWDSIY